MSTLLHAQATESSQPAASSDRRRIPAVLTAIVLLAVAHGPILLVYCRVLSHREHYRIFPIMWLVLAGLLWHRGGPIRLRWPAVALLAVDVTLVLLASWVNSSLVGFAGFACGCLALLVSAQDQITGRSLWPLILLLVPTVRLPMNLDAQVIHELQLATTTSASQILERLNVVHFRQGVVLQLPEQELFVEEACSGIHSLFTLFGLAIIIAVVFRQHWLPSLLLFASAAVWAYFLNVVRVVIVALGAAWWGCDLASGWSHDVLGYALVGVSLVCLLSTDRLLVLLTAPIVWETQILQPEDVPGLVRWFNAFFLPPWLRTRPLQESADRRQRSKRWPVGLALGGVVVVIAQVIPLSFRELGRLWQPLPWYAEGSLPASYGTWLRGEFATERRSSSNIWGEHSCRWEFSRGSQAAQVSLDYPFEGWHELTRCYAGAGWQMSEREVIYPEDAPDWPVVAARMWDELGRHGQLYFSLIASDGRPVEPRSGSLRGAFTARWQRATGAERTVQMQAFTGSLIPLTGEESQQLLRLHLETRRDLRAAVLAPVVAGDAHD